MKRIYIVRHAKSSWADLTQRDIERPLNQRGIRDAPIMASHCKVQKYLPELIISSNAQRAKETSVIFQDVFNSDTINYRIESNLYHAPENTYFEECSLLEEDVQSVMLFGHNPGITYLANSVSKTFIDNVPTCGVLVIDCKVETWDQVDPNNCTLIDFIYPKKLNE